MKLFLWALLLGSLWLLSCQKPNTENNPVERKDSTQVNPDTTGTTNTLPGDDVTADGEATFFLLKNDIDAASTSYSLYDRTGSRRWYIGPVPQGWIPSPCAFNGVLYLSIPKKPIPVGYTRMDLPNTLHAINIANGIDLWTKEFPTYQDLFVRNDTVFSVSQSNHDETVATACNARTGELYWRATVPQFERVESFNPILSGDKIYIKANGPSTVSIGGYGMLDLNTHKISFPEQPRLALLWTPQGVAAGNLIFDIDMEYNLVAIKASDKLQYAWQTASDEWFNYLLYGNKTIYASYIGVRNSPCLYAFDPATGSVRWKSEAIRLNDLSKAVYKDKKLFALVDDYKDAVRSFAWFDAGDGHLLNRKPVSMAIQHPTLIGDEIIAVRGAYGGVTTIGVKPGLVIFNGRTGEAKDSLAIPDDLGYFGIITSRGNFVGGNYK